MWMDKLFIFSVQTLRNCQAFGFYCHGLVNVCIVQYFILNWYWTYDHKISNSKDIKINLDWIILIINYSKTLICPTTTNYEQAWLKRCLSNLYLQIRKLELIVYSGGAKIELLTFLSWTTYK